jgi:DNA-binding PadR family transcriptional regulator
MKGSPLKGALLALLLELDEPIHVYRLATLLARRLEPVMRVEREGVYGMLDVLERLGLVTREIRKGERGGLRNDQRFYSASEMTGPAVTEWMAAPVSDGTAKVELLIRIAVSQPSHAPILLEILRMCEVRCLDRLSRYEKQTNRGENVAPSTWKGLAIGVVSLWTKKHTQAELEWIMSTRDWMDDYILKHEAARQ